MYLTQKIRNSQHVRMLCFPLFLVFFLIPLVMLQFSFNSYQINTKGHELMLRIWYHRFFMINNTQFLNKSRRKDEENEDTNLGYKRRIEIWWGKVERNCKPKRGERRAECWWLSWFFMRNLETSINIKIRDIFPFGLITF